MAIPDLAARVIDGFKGNPFDVDPQTRVAAAEAAEALRTPVTIRHLLDRGNIEQAKLLILAIGHHRACQTPDEPERVLPGKLLPRSVVARLPRPVSDYLRIVMAAGRCYRTLESIRGSSTLLRRTRRDTWAACFGDSLRQALDLEQVIHDHDVLILGETGTGKESFAKAIQVATPGAPDGSAAPSATINAAALPETLVESELFGHVKGAFTGASETRVGRLRSASGGCFFLDEVGDLPSTTQVKLLRVIESNEVYPLGSDAAEKVEVRYVAATHKNLETLVERGEFRRDLFERLAGNIIRIPPLRDRPEDMVEIGKYFVASYRRGARPGTGKTIIDASSRIDSWLESAEARGYHWPGNVRELQNALRNLLLGLPPGLKDRPTQEERERRKALDELPPAIAGSSAPLQVVSDWYMDRVLAHVDGNFSQAAKILDVDRSTVRRRTQRRGR